MIFLSLPEMYKGLVETYKPGNSLNRRFALEIKNIKQ